MTIEKMSDGFEEGPKIAIANIGLRVVETLGSLKTIRKTCIGNRGEFTSVIRSGESILRFVEIAKRSSNERAMDLVDLVELIALHWLDEIHRIVDEAAGV